MYEKFLVVAIEDDASKPVKDTSGTRPAFTKPVMYVLEDGRRITGRPRLSRMKDVQPYIEDLKKAALGGFIKVSLQVDGSLGCVERCFVLG